jgi:putative peptidoglycan lipid II flippase
LSGDVKDEPASERSGRFMVRAAGLISGLTALSRLLGLVREQVFAALLGAGPHADAYQIAFRIPNLLRDLFAEGALSAAFVPTYAAALAQGGREAGHRLARRILTLLGAVLALVLLLGFIGAPWIVDALAPGYERIAGKTELTILLSRVMLPFLPLVSCAAVAMGMLNAQEKYGGPAAAPAMFNVVTIAWGVLLWLLGFDPVTVALGWSIGTVLGGLAQLGIQLPALRKEGFRFRPEWAPRDPGIRRVAALMAPATLGLAAVQFNIFISSRFASHEPGAVSWLTYAFRILYLPIGVFGVALGTIAATGLAKSAATGDIEGLRRTLRQALRMLGFLSIPATVGLGVLAVPIVRLLYERGVFGAADTAATAVALGYYAIGLVAYTGVKVLAPAFYALDSPRIPLLGSALAVGTNLLTILLLYDRLGFRGVALGTSLGSLINAAVLLVSFERRVGGLQVMTLLAAGARMAAAAAGMGVVAHYALAALEGALGTRGLRAQLATGLLPVGLGLAAYAGFCRLLRVSELDLVATALRRRRQRA